MAAPTAGPALTMAMSTRTLPGFIRDTRSLETIFGALAPGTDHQVCFEQLLLDRVLVRGQGPDAAPVHPVGAANTSCDTGVVDPEEPDSHPLTEPNWTHRLLGFWL